MSLVTGSSASHATEWLIVGIVLIAPFIFAIATAPVVAPDTGRWGGVAIIASITTLEAALTALAIWAVHRRGDPLSSIGIIRPHGTWLIVFVIGIVIAAVLAALRTSGIWTVTPGRSEIGAVEYTDLQRAALLALSVPQIYLQELLYRGFAITFLERLVGSTRTAVVIAAIAFALAHVTSLAGNPIAGLVSVAVAGALLGWLYVGTRDLLPVTCLHWLWVAWLTVGASIDPAPADGSDRP